MSSECTLFSPPIAVRLVALVTLCLLSVTGCGSGGPSLSGVITLDGNPLPDGSISLVPLDGGPTVGAKIQNGTYRIGNLPPGKYRVDIMSFRDEEETITSSEEMQRRAEAGEGDASSHSITENAIGNDVEFEVTEGSQKHDFVLTSPDAR